MTVAENRRQKAIDVATPRLEPDERVVAVLPGSQTGPSPWAAMMLTYLLYLFVKMYAVIVTDRRVIFVRCSAWTGGPREVDATYPRSAVRVVEWRERGLWSTLRLERDGAPMRLNVARPFRAGGGEVADALSGTASS